MTTDYTTLGTAEIFPFYPQWVRDPSYKISVPRTLISYEGTVQWLQPLVNSTPYEITLEYFFTNKQEEYDFQKFFEARRGMWERFWVRKPGEVFFITEQIASSQGILYVTPNSFDAIAQGYERIYIAMRNGDEMIRKIINVDNTQVITNDRLLLTLDTATAWELNVTRTLPTPTIKDCYIGKLLLMRFDSDRISFNYLTNGTSKVMLRFKELVQEYSEMP